MGRFAILAGFTLLGFAIGFIAYLVSPTLIDFLAKALPQLFSDPRVAGAFLSGIAGAIIMDVTIILWSYLSK
jgi:hypothetical protein